MADFVLNPYASGGMWLRGNLHTHSTFSDGSRPVEEVLADYSARGYDFLALTDHDVFVNPERYNDITELALVPGVEVSRYGPHILHLDATDKVEPERDRQAVIDRIREQGAFAVLNHPNWGHQFNHFPHDLMEQLDGYAGIEIYNGVIDRLPGASLATDRWDRLLSQGRTLWGFANDDAHLPTDVGLAWNVVLAPEKTAEAVSAALRTGSFYASTGVEITNIQMRDDALRIETANATRIRFISRHGVFQQTTEGDRAEFPLPRTIEDAKSLGYVRAECYGSGGRVAWTQPFFCREDT